MFWALMLLLSADWTALIPTAAKSVPRLEMQLGEKSGVCSGVVFEIDADGYAHALTAAHCVAKQPNERLDLTVNGRNGVVLHTNGIVDLAIVKFRAKGEVAIVIASDEPPVGSDVAILGYAFGVEEYVAQFGHIAQSRNRETKTTWVNADLIFGDSGGALIDAQGRLVGINSAIHYQGPAHMGAVVSVTQIRDYIDYFLALRKETQKKP